MTDIAALDKALDAVVRSVYATDLPPTLYHYTSWTGAEGILKTRRIWATAHHCTNDPAEIITADDTIVQVASAMLHNQAGLPHEVLRLFIENYGSNAVGALMRVYLACFSIAGDDAKQFQTYGDGGRGLSLGVRILNEPPPSSPHRGSGLIRVDYSEASWRGRLERAFAALCQVLSGLPISDATLTVGLSAAYRIAAFLAVSAKTKDWAHEQEVRHLTFVSEDHPPPLTRLSGGNEVQYIEVEGRANDKRFSLAEIVVGPKLESADASVAVKSMLAAASYTEGDDEYPTISASSPDGHE